MAGEIFDDPNRQAVGLDPAWVEGTGGGTGGETPPPPGNGEEGGGETPTAADLDAMTKDELLAHAQGLGITPANASMTKDELRAGVDAYYGR